MFDVNSMIAANIVAILKKQNRKQIDLAGALQTNKQTISKMLNGSRMINAIELKRIAEFLGVKMEELTKLQGDSVIQILFMRSWEKLNQRKLKKHLILLISFQT